MNSSSQESYAGHYVPQLAELVYDRNKDRTQYPFINLKRFIVGNPVTNDYYDFTGIVDYAWSHSVISDELYHKAKRVCDFKVSDWSIECNDVVNEVLKNTRKLIFIISMPPNVLLTAHFHQLLVR